MNIVGNETHAEVARRFLYRARKVCSCRCHKNEIFAVFARRFRDVAEYHLNSFEHPRSDEEKQYVALVLLRNAALANFICDNI